MVIVNSGFLTRINDFSVYPTKTVNPDTGGFCERSLRCGGCFNFCCLGFELGVCVSVGIVSSEVLRVLMI